MLKPILAITLLFGVSLARAQQVTSDLFIDFTSPSDLNYFIQETGDNGWGNNEQQMYTNQNAIIQNGVLNIITERTTDGRYLSARLISKSSFKYGEFEMRAKLPRGRGTWAAFWLLSAKRPLNWPQDGEIDIMEHVGYDQDVVHGTIHTKKNNHMIGTQIGKSIKVAGLSEKFHVYKLVWTPTRLVVSLDKNEFFTYNKVTNANSDSWPFDDYFNIIVNTAVGGDWGGQQGIDNSIFPQNYTIDYIKYTAFKGDNDSGSSVIAWNEDSSTGFKWAIACDFRGKDLASVMVKAEKCASTCLVKPGCTHFAWTKFNGGTCWMKKGKTRQSNAIKNKDQSSVCGYNKRK